MFKPIRLVPSKTNFDFLGKRVPALVLSTIANVAAIALALAIGLNFGIDFRGGIAIEAKARQGAADLASLRATTGDLGLGEVALQEFGGPESVLIRVQRQEGGAQCAANAQKVLVKRAGPGHTLRAVGAAPAGDVEIGVPAGGAGSERWKEIAAHVGLTLADRQVPRAGAATARVEMTAEQKDEWCQQVAIRVVEDAIGGRYTFQRTESVGPKIGSELMQTGILAVALTLVAIAAYVWFRFEWQFGVAALIALFHDVITTIGLFALFQLEFNLAALAAVLTIAGYSINDTVVVFDRVRENLRRYKKLSLVELLNVSVNETLSRTLMTSGTVFLAVMALVVFGGPVLHSFSIAMLWGVIVGTYSSIWIACAALVYFDLRPERIAAAEEAARAAAAARP